MKIGKLYKDAFAKISTTEIMIVVDKFVEDDKTWIMYYYLDSPDKVYRSICDIAYTFHWQEL